MERLVGILPPGATIIVKQGSAGAMGKVCADRKGVDIIRVAAPVITPVDTIGAGDVFNAGYLAAVAGGMDLRSSIEAGVAIASRAVSTLPRRYDIAAA
jgi:sugar/nucleoside kinase (ribokinase family)